MLCPGKKAASSDDEDSYSGSDDDDLSVSLEDEDGSMDGAGGSEAIGEPWQLSVSGLYRADLSF